MKKLFCAGFIITLLLSSIVSCSIIRRAIFDIGSVGTKMEVADVDVSSHTIKNVIVNRAKNVGYKSDLMQQKDPSCFSESIIQKGIGALNEFKELSKTFTPPPSQFQAIATAGFRAAVCSDLLIKRVEKETGIPVKIISQEKEAELAFRGIIAKTGVNPAHAVSWEIGGGSMQIAFQLPNNKLLIYNGLGNIPFRNLVMSEIQHCSKSATPNPLSKADAYKSVQLAQYLWAQNVSHEIKEKINTSNTKVLGTGSIVNIVRRATGNNSKSIFTRDEIEHALYNHVAGLSDQDLGPISEENLDTSILVTGLALVVGYMRALDIREITLVKSAMREGALIDPTIFVQ